MLTWRNIVTEAPGGVRQQHLVPNQDLREHQVYEHCPCGPVEDEVAPDYFVHRAWDGREKHEAGAALH